MQQDNFLSFLLAIGAIVWAISIASWQNLQTGSTDAYAVFLVTVIVGSLLLGWACIRAVVGPDWFAKISDKAPASEKNLDSNRQLGGVGGDGGNARVKGNGAAIAGPAGRGGTSGLGGKGGDAILDGDGVAVGGAGGHSGEEGVWKPPARSGYEVFMRAIGQRPDPNSTQYGRGGAMPGYMEKLDLIKQLSREFLLAERRDQNLDLEIPGSVPLDFLNGRLAARREIWRARIIDDQYEFFIPAT